MSWARQILAETLAASRAELAIQGDAARSAELTATAAPDPDREHAQGLVEGVEAAVAAVARGRATSAAACRAAIDEEELRFLARDFTLGPRSRGHWQGLIRAREALASGD